MSLSVVLNIIKTLLEKARSTNHKYKGGTGVLTKFFIVHPHPPGFVGLCNPFNSFDYLAVFWISLVQCLEKASSLLGRMTAPAMSKDHASGIAMHCSSICMLTGQCVWHIRKNKCLHCT
jgi:hypothetical protein